MRGAPTLQRPLALGLTCAAVFWTAAILFVPLGTSASTLPVRTAIRAAASLVCHQRADRSFSWRGVRLPVCARCTGLYLAGAVGALAAWPGRARTSRRARAALAAAAAPTVLSVALEWMGLIAPGNFFRFVLALPLGVTAGWLFVRMLRAEAAQSTCVIIS